MSAIEVPVAILTIFEPAEHSPLERIAVHPAASVDIDLFLINRQFLV